MVSGTNKEKIERARRELDGSGLSVDTKDGLQNLLDAAGHAANGAEDKIQALCDVVFALSLHEVKLAVRLPTAIEDAVKKHAVQCKGKIPDGKWGWLFLFRWPVSVFACAAVFSPHFGSILEFVKQLVSRG
jgi:hypothetical protein